MTNRFIIVLGMAHSGTTIFTKTLSQCPDIFLVANGPQAFLLENEYLIKSDPRVVNLLDVHHQRYLLLKRPWMAERTGYFQTYLSDAHYYIMLKSFDRQAKSWSKPNSLIEDELRTNPEVQKRRYERCLNNIMNFPLPRRIVLYDDLLNDPKSLFDSISAELGLNYEFNVQEIEKFRINRS